LVKSKSLNKTLLKLKIMDLDNAIYIIISIIGFVVVAYTFLTVRKTKTGELNNVLMIQGASIFLIMIHTLTDGLGIDNAVFDVVFFVGSILLLYSSIKLYDFIKKFSN
jgi:hypothetical protein